MSLKIKVKETKTGRQMRMLTNEKKVAFRVGVFGSDNSEMVTIGAVHEFGAEIEVKESRFVQDLGKVVKEGTIIRIPARRWASLAMERNEKFIKKLIRQVLKRIGEGKLTIDKANNIVAITLASLTKQNLGVNMPPPLKYRQGTPLVDNGDLRKSIGTKIITNKGISNTLGYGDDR